MIPTLPEEKNSRKYANPLIVSKDDKSPFKQFLKRSTDMKLTLEFLKRKHTKDPSPSVRPSPLEASEWAESFQVLMSSKYGQALFKAFLERDFCEENIEFWLAVEDYRKSRPNKLNSKAQKIYEEFIIPQQAPKEINLDAMTRTDIEGRIDQPSLSIFDQAQRRIQGLLESDAYSRFLKSDLYLELVHPENYEQVIGYVPA